MRTTISTDTIVIDGITHDGVSLIDVNQDIIDTTAFGDARHTVIGGPMSMQLEIDHRVPQLDGVPMQVSTMLQPGEPTVFRYVAHIADAYPYRGVLNIFTKDSPRLEAARWAAGERARQAENEEMVQWGWEFEGDALRALNAFARRAHIEGKRPGTIDTTRDAKLNAGHHEGEYWSELTFEHSYSWIEIKAPVTGHTRDWVTVYHVTEDHGDEPTLASVLKLLTEVKT